MKEPLSCLTGIVGVADTDCDCYEDGRPDDYNEAASGLYLNQLVDLDLLAQAYQCQGATVWSIGAKAIKEATIRFQNNLLQCWSAKHKAREQWKGLVGERDCPQVLTPGTTYAGLLLCPDSNIEQGEIVITGIGTMFTQTAEVTVTIYDNVTGALHEVDLDTTANTFQSNTLGTPIVLPFNGTDGTARRYWILYTVTSNKPKLGDVNCGCSSKQERMKEWGGFYGTKGNDLALRSEWGMDGNHYGLLPEITIRCGVEKGICDDTLDFATNPNAGVMAEAIWYLAASMIPDMIRRSTKILPGTTLPSDELAADAQKHAGEFSARVQALCTGMSPGSCYVCKPKMGLRTMNF